MSASPPPRRLARAEAVLAARVRRIVLVLEDTHDRHNISAALRTCEAFGVQDVHLVLESALPTDINPAVTIEADRWLTLDRHAGAERALQHLRARGYRICVSQLAADAVPLPELPRDRVPAVRRHVDVEHADMGLELANRIDHATTTRQGAHDMAVLLEQDAQRQHDVGVVVGDHDAERARFCFEHGSSVSHWGLR